MKCKKAVESITDYLDGNLDAAVSADFEAHLRECANCAAELRDTESLVDMMGSLSGKRMPVDCWLRVRELISLQQPEHAWRRLFLNPIVAAPAMAAVLVLGALMFWPGGIQETPNDAAITIPEYNHYISVHSRSQRQQAFTDPDVIFISSELERANLRTVSNDR